MEKNFKKFFNSLYTRKLINDIFSQLITNHYFMQNESPGGSTPVA